MNYSKVQNNVIIVCNGTKLFQHMTLNGEMDYGEKFKLNNYMMFTRHFTSAPTSILVLHTVHTTQVTKNTRFRTYRDILSFQQ